MSPPLASFLPSFLLFLFHPSPPLSSPSLPSFLHPLLSKFVKATSPCFSVPYFPFPLSIYLPFPHPPPLPSTSLTNTRKNIYQAYGKWRKAVHRTSVGRNDEHKRLTVKDNKIIFFSFTAKGNDLAVFHRNNHFPFPSSLLTPLLACILLCSSFLHHYPFTFLLLRFFLSSSLPPPPHIHSLHPQSVVLCGSNIPLQSHSFFGDFPFFYYN